MNTPRHFFLRDDRRFPVACVATTFQSDSIVAYALSIFNPHDAFSKVRGRDVAIGRLHKHPSTLLIHPGDNIKQGILADIAANTGLPKRVRDAAVLWLSHTPPPLTEPRPDPRPIEEDPDFAPPLVNHSTEPAIFDSAQDAEPPQIEMTLAPEDEAKLSRIFAGVHSRPEQPYSWND